MEEKLDKLIMDEHWKLVEQRPYPMFKGVWEKSQILPTTHTYNFEEELNEHLEIPFVGGGYIRLGKTAGDEVQISVELKFPTARGEMQEARFIVNDVLKTKPYPFWIYYDDDSQNERMKFLSRMKPEKDIDWKSIEPNTAEEEIAEALCKYKASETPPQNS